MLQGTATLNADGTITFDPAPNYNGAVSFDYTIEDADGDASVATVELTVDPVDDLPVAADDTGLVDAGGHRARDHGSGQ